MKFKNYMRFKKLKMVDFEKGFFDEEYLSRLQLIAEDLIFINEQNIEKRNALIKDADALVIRYFTSLDRQAIDSMSDLKYIGASSVSVDQVDVAHAKKKGTVMTNIAGYSSDSIAEFVFGVLLEHIRNLAKSLKRAEEKDFTVHSEYQAWELKGKTFGILGLGNIGKRVGEIALGFGMKVQYYSRNRKSDYEKKGFTFVDCDQLFLTSDVLANFLELNDETRGMITEKYITLVKKDAVVISTSSTEIFHFSALIDTICGHK